MPDVLPLSVRRYGRDVFLVRSEVPAKQEDYVTEIPNKEQPHGQCSCKDWQCRIGCFLNRGEEPEKYRCKHQVRAMATLDGLAQLIEMQGLCCQPVDLVPWA